MGDKKWEKRELTLKGKKLLIHSYLIPIISHGIEMYPDQIPDNFIKDTKNIICNFMWGGNTWRVSKQTCALRRTHGGLELPDIENLIRSKKIQWIMRIHFSENKKWNTIGKEMLSRYDSNYGQKHFLLNCSNLIGINL